MTPIRVDIETSDYRLIRELSESRLSVTSSGVEVDDATRSPGFGENLYEISAAIGLVSLPVGILGNLLASWIWESMSKRRQPGDVRLIIRNDESEFQLDLHSQDCATIAKSIELALGKLGVK